MHTLCILHSQNSIYLTEIPELLESYLDNDQLDIFNIFIH